ncbi:hypothetical protein [Nonomuraea salmonea]|uniref:Uncharacterized protein n=1 Tax=Nonomuraea salmonea TaxID=46181 RepID=A0ABV5P414_9ACTN
MKVMEMQQQVRFYMRREVAVELLEMRDMDAIKEVLALLPEAYEADPEFGGMLERFVTLRVLAIAAFGAGVVAEAAEALHEAIVGIHDEY